MPGPAERTVGDLFLEILAPTRSCRRKIICDCCRRPKGASSFDEDGFGICSDCLGSDALLVELDASLKPDPSTQS